MRALGTIGRAVRALCVLAAIAAGVPLLLVQLSTWRFGSALPWAGITWPSQGSFTQWGGSLAGRVTDEMIVDLTVRVAVLLGWVCVGLLLVSLAAEMWHLWRHGSPRSLDGPGPRWSRQLVRSVAAGLLLMVPLAGSAVAALGPSGASESGRPAGAVTAHALADTHLVRSGDTLWEIAEQRLGDPLRWDEIWTMNRGRVMADGRVFEDPHLILPGWDLHLPSDGSVPTDSILAPEERDDVRVERWEPTVPSAVDVRSAMGIPRLEPPGGPYLGTEVLSEAATDRPEELEVPRAPDIEPAPEVTDRTQNHDVLQEAEFDPFPEHSSIGGMLVGVAGATMLATGILAGIAGRRRSRLRASAATSRPSLVDGLQAGRYPPDGHLGVQLQGEQPFPEGAGEYLDGDDDLGLRTGGPLLEDLRHAADAERILRLDLVLRLVSVPLMVVDQAISAVLMDAQGTIEILTTAPVDLEPPFHGAGRRWVVPADADLEELIEAAAEIPQPSPALIHLGNTPDGREVFVDLEVIGVLSLIDPEADPTGTARDPLGLSEVSAVLRAVQMMLFHSPFSQDLRSVWVGEGCPVWPEEAGSEGVCTIEVCGDFAAAQQWYREVAVAAGELRVVLVAAPHELDLAPAWVWEEDLIVVGGGLTPATGAILTPRGDRWVLAGPVMDGEEIMIIPVGVSPAEAEDVKELMEAETAQEALVYRAEPPVRDVEARSAGVSSVAVLESVPMAGVSAFHAVPAPDPAEESMGLVAGIMVRLMGPVDVINPRGEPARFTRSKSLELLAWCVTHRNRSTRGSARTALWESDVRDSTFANIVSEARRATTQLEPPPPGRHWVRRTMTEELVLDPDVTSDVEIMRATLRRVDSDGLESMVAEAERAVGLIRGMPFEGTSYLWPEAEGISSDLILVATSLAAMLAIHHLDRGDVAGVFRATGAGLLALPGHEELIALRMRAHARVGDLAGVRQEWAAYQRVIARDPWSGGEPAPKLLALSRELLGPTP